MDEIDEISECVRLKWNTSNDADYPKRKEGEDEVPEVFEWFGIGPLRFTAVLVNLLRDNYFNKPFMYPRNRTQQSFCARRFASDFGEAFRSINAIILFI